MEDFTKEELKMWELYSESISKTSSYNRNPCAYDGHRWAKTDMKISFCTVCEISGEFDFETGRYRVKV